MPRTVLRRVTTDYYDTRWKTFNKTDLLRRIDALTPVLKPMLSYVSVRNDCRLLDIGVGPGTLAAKIAMNIGDLECEIHGVDNSPEAVTCAGRLMRELGLAENVKIKLGDAEKLPYPSAYFDIVVSNATLNLVQNKLGAFSEISRVTRPEGIVVLGDCIRSQNSAPSSIRDNARLWAVCITGALSLQQFDEMATSTGLRLLETKDLTTEVRKLTRKGIWKWPEFAQYKMRYYIFKLGKTAKASAR